MNLEEPILLIDVNRICMSIVMSTRFYRSHISSECRFQGGDYISKSMVFRLSAQSDDPGMLSSLSLAHIFDGYQKKSILWNNN
jgi:hypothetical protein